MIPSTHPTGWSVTIAHRSSFEILREIERVCFDVGPNLNECSNLWIELIGGHQVWQSPTYPNIPVGPSIVQSPGTVPGGELSDLGDSEPQSALPAGVVGQAGPITVEDVPEQNMGITVTQTWQDYMAGGGTLPADYGSYPMASDYPWGGADLNANLPPGGDVAFSWGDFFEDLGDLGIEYVGGMLGAPQPGSSFTPTVASTGVGTLNPTLGVGGPPINPQTGQPYKNMLYNPRTGKWTRCRRRRRKLLTDSDFNGLLKIQTLKVNNNMSIAIAKALSR